MEGGERCTVKSMKKGNYLKESKMKVNIWSDVVGNNN